MIRCLCTGAAPLARLLSPPDAPTQWPNGVEAFLAGEGFAFLQADERRTATRNDSAKTAHA